MKTPDSRFYSPHLTIGTFSLNENESHHAIKVCRATIGDALELSDGLGHFATGIIKEANPKACLVKVTQIEMPKKNRPPLNIAIACLKDDALEDVVFHAAQTELDSITFLRTDFSQENKNSDLHKLIHRSELKSLVSLKQSKKPWLTEIKGPIEFHQWIEIYKGDLILCDINGEKQIPIEIANKLNDSHQGSCPITLLIGPEGGFSEREFESIDNFKNGKIYKLNLGSTRLRAKTAAIIALGKII